MGRWAARSVGGGGDEDAEEACVRAGKALPGVVERGFALEGVGAVGEVGCPLDGGFAIFDGKAGDAEAARRIPRVGPRDVLLPVEESVPVEVPFGDGLQGGALHQPGR